MIQHGRTARDVDRDVITALWHPEYRDRPFFAAYRDVRRRRDEWV